MTGLLGPKKNAYSTEVPIFSSSPGENLKVQIEHSDLFRPWSLSGCHWDWFYCSLSHNKTLQTQRPSSDFLIFGPNLLERIKITQVKVVVLEYRNLRFKFALV